MALLERLDGIRVHRRRGQRAPNKPLTLLYALGRVAQEEPQLVEYRDAEGPLDQLLKRFGRPTSERQRPEFAYWRLRNDGLWEIPEDGQIRETDSGDPSVPQLHEYGAGRFPDEIHEELEADPELVHRAIQKILDEYFPSSLHDDIRSDIGVPSRPLPGSRRPRDSRFRRKVLRVYDYRCAICSSRLHMDDNLVGLDAAHIKWHCKGGPDEIDNGLALCTLHHKAFDYGAVGLEPSEAGFRVKVSRSVHGSGATADLILDYHGSAIRSPLATDERPASEHVQWHSREVFRDPPRPLGA